MKTIFLLISIFILITSILEAEPLPLTIINPIPKDRPAYYYGPTRLHKGIETEWIVPTVNPAPCDARIEGGFSARGGVNLEKELERNKIEYYLIEQSALSI